jgi:hypothetical protein
LRDHFPRLGRDRVRQIALPLLVVALLAEHLAVPYPLAAVEPAPFYQQLAASAEEGAVLELPFSITRATSLFGQTVHGKPIIGGYLSRPLDYPILAVPPFAVPALFVNDITPPLTVATGRGILRASRVGWIVDLRDDSKRNPQEIAAFLRDYAAPDPLYADERMAVYRPLAPEAPQFALRPTAGWHQAESLADRRRMRWLPWEGTIEAWSLADDAQGGTLQFESWSFNQPRRLQIAVDGQILGEWIVAEPKSYTLPLTLTPGRHTITFRTLDPPERPARTVGGADDRLISIGVTGVTLR